MADFVSGDSAISRAIASCTGQGDSSSRNQVGTASADEPAERTPSEAGSSDGSCSSSGPTGNTGIQTSIYPPMGLVGVDTLIVTVEGKKQVHFDDLSSQIAAAVDSRRRGDFQASVKITGATLFPRPRGFGCGASWFDHVLEYDGIVYALHANWPSRFVSTGDRPTKQDVSLVGKGRFAAKVEIGSTRLLRDGVHAAWHDAVAVLEELGIAVVDSCVSRIDVRADIVNVPIAEFARALSERRYVTDFKKGYTLIPSDPSETETCYLGTRGHLTLRIYDKLAQLRNLPEVEGDVKWELLMRDVLAGAPITALTRVEWEMCRQFLSRFDNCRSVEGVLASLPLLLDRVNTETFGLTVEPNRGNGNQARLTVSPLWEHVTRVFAGYTGAPTGKLDRPMERPVETAQVMKQLLHRVTSVAAVQAVAIETADDLFRVIVALLRMEINDDHVLAVYAKRQKLAKSGLAHTLGLDEFIQPPDVPF